jgi:tRNA G10  N-methylase Trm11
VLTPFMGVGSEVCASLVHGRKAIGIELKASYYKQALRNIDHCLEHGFADLAGQDTFIEEEVAEVTA